MFLVLSLLAAVVLLVLDINNAVHLSYWWIGFIAAFPILLSIALALLGLFLMGLAVLLEGAASKAKAGRK